MTSAVLIALSNLLVSLCSIDLVDMSINYYNLVTHCVLVQYSLDAFICFTHKQEVIRQTGHGKKADIWSVGCTVIQALARVSAFRIHVCLWVPFLVALWSWKSVCGGCFAVFGHGTLNLVAVLLRRKILPHSSLGDGADCCRSIGCFVHIVAVG